MSTITNRCAGGAVAMILFALASPVNSQSNADADGAVSAGEKLFNVKCHDCHALDKRRVGPPLAGVSERRSPEWLKAWLQDPVTMATSDPVAIALKAEFQTQMPKLGLSKDEIELLLAFLKTHPPPKP